MSNRRMTDPLHFMRVKQPAKPRSKSTEESEIAAAQPAWQLPSTRQLWKAAEAHFGLTFENDSRTTSAKAQAKQEESEPQFFDVLEDASMHERWLEVLQGRSAVECSEAELRSLVDLGTPLRHRHMLWRRWWAQATNEVQQHSESPDLEQSAMQIELDLNRTFARSLSGDQRDLLRGVLCAYAQRNPMVGYCQGMSFIAAVPLLLEFSTEDAFACLRYVVEEVCPGYHGPRLQGYFRDIAVLQALVRTALPTVHSALEQFDIPLHMLATDHLLTLSARTWPMYPVVRLWDVVLMEGSAALLASFLALLQMYFLYAVGDAKFVHKDQLDEIPTAVALRFRELASSGIARDTDQLLQRTRKFIPLVRGEGSGKEENLLSRLRKEAESSSTESASESATKGGYVRESLREPLTEEKNSTRSASEQAACLPKAQAVSNTKADTCSETFQYLLLEARVTIDDGTVQTLHVGVEDRCKKVAQSFVQRHSLDKSCTDPLTAWLKKAESDAMRYPAKVEGVLEDICKMYAKAA